MMGIKHQKEIPNDQMDIIHLAVAIPFCDIVITDKSKTFDIKETTLDRTYNTTVYLGSSSDLKNSTSHLEQLLLSK